MLEAAQEEKRIAIEQGKLHEGVLAITVVLDGGWCKRMHKHSYNAKSGIAIIIGLATGKILYFGVRNKYCSVCAASEKSGQTPQAHECFKNWDGPSSSMETDILVEGFKQAEKYGLRYTIFVGDGDSSAYPSLIAEVPVWGHSIQKLECVNHAIKCYRSAREKLVQQKPQYKGKGKLTEAMRKRLTMAARCAIKMRSAEPDRKRATELLHEDLRNGPLHCFGNHANCETDYCKFKQSTYQSDNILQSSSADCPAPQPVNFDDQVSSEMSAVSAVALEEAQAWCDAMNEDEIEAVRCIPPQSSPIDPEMLCDIQQIVSRLIAKAPQLLGKCRKNDYTYADYNNKHNNY